MANKKAFTLIEILVSISLFMIIVLFLYQSLDVTKQSNQFFSDKVVEQNNKVNLKEILFKDIVHSYSGSISEDRDKRTIFQINTSNTYHNSFYQNVTYLVSKEDNLLRIESKNKFNKDKLNDDFFDKAYVDTVYSKVKKFKVTKKDKDKYAMYIKFADETDIMVIFKSMR